MDDDPSLMSPDVAALKLEHYRAHSAAAAANGVLSSLRHLEPQVPVWFSPTVCPCVKLPRALTIHPLDEIN